MTTLKISRKEIAKSIKEVAPHLSFSEADISSYFIETPFREYLVSQEGKKRLKFCFERIGRVYGEGAYRAFLSLTNKEFKDKSIDPESALEVALEKANEMTIEDNNHGYSQPMGKLRTNSR